MPDAIRDARAIVGSAGLDQRTIDITTTGRRSGQPRRIETVFYRFQDTIYLSGSAGSRRILGQLVAEFDERRGPDAPWPEAVLEEWMAGSPLARVGFDDELA